MADVAEVIDGIATHIHAYDAGFERFKAFLATG
jgi:hypothetical protein